MVLGSRNKELAEEVARLPYIASKVKFEEVYEAILSLDLPEKSRTYFDRKYSIKEKWAYCYKKTLPCLKVATTSRIEGLNSLIKENISLSTSICELFHRILKMHTSITNKPYPSQKKLSSQVLEDLGKMISLKQLESLLSAWAYQECAVSFSQSWNLEVKSNRKAYIFTDKLNEEYEFTIQKPIRSAGPLCSCAYFMTLGLPCPHLFALSRDYSNVVDLKTSIRRRWLKVASFQQFEDKQLINSLDKYFSTRVNPGENFFNFK